MNMMTHLFPDHDGAPPKPRVTESDFFLPLIIIGGVTLLLMVLGTHLAVRGFDRASAIREQVLTQNGISQQLEEVGAMVVPQTMWDDATANLDVSFNPQWAEDNLGRYLYQTDADDRPIFSSGLGRVRNPGAYAPVAPLAAPLVRAVRRKELARGALHRMESGAMVSKAIQASSLELVNGRLSILTATLVQPDFGKALPKGMRSPIVVTQMPIGKDFLDTFSRRYLLDGFHIRALGTQPDAGEIEVPATNARGEVVGYLAWRPLAPGYTMLREFLPPLGVVLIMLGALAFIQLRNIHVAARILLDREESFAASMSDLHSWQEEHLPAR
jgi:hypothetical protein